MIIDPSAQEPPPEAAIATELLRQQEAEATIAAMRYRENQTAREKQWAKFRKDNTSPPGTIPGLSALLEARRLAFQIPDCFFQSQPCNNRVNVFQIESIEGDTYEEGGRIIMSDIARERSRESAPKGILLGGGLKAMDQMYSNGIAPGHVVNFIHMNPWRKVIASIGGQEKHVLVMTVGDITDSDDLSAFIKGGQVRAATRHFTLDDGYRAVEHFWQDTKTNEMWDPFTAEYPEEDNA